MTDDTQDIVIQVLRFYANRSNYGNYSVVMDQGIKARLALSILEDNPDLLNKNTVWLTEELANMAGFEFREIDEGFIIKWTVNPEKILYAGCDMEWTQLKELATCRAFGAKYLARLALAKDFERKNRKNLITNLLKE